MPAPVLRRQRTARSADDAVAIIGASGRFPKAADLGAFWDNIRQGRDCIEEVPAGRWDISRFYHPDPAHPDTTYCRWMGVMDDIEYFDAGFFTITPREAELMDPQQRLFLQHAWQAFEDAGLDPASLGGTACGIFVGSGPSGYAERIVERNAYSLLGSSGSILAARIAHLLDLRGPCLSLDTACSSSLVAIAEACNSLLLGDSDLALAGGVSIMIGPKMFIDTAKVGMLSKDGRCFSFDARANGFVPGEGSGVVVLKRLADAIADNDPIHAVIRGWGINQDGRTNGITAPNPQAQTRLIRQVQDRFGIAADTIGLIECHGTGTPLGDPIEVEGLTDAFAGSGMAEGSCALSSVKSNMGHLLAAAGVAGALKAMLAVKHGQLPPSINFESLNSHIRLSGTPFAVNTALKAWPATQIPRRAAVSAFGFSGTNAHLVIEQAPEPPRRNAAPAGPWLLVLSARTDERLTALAAQLERFVTAHPDLACGDIAYTLQVGRKALAKRAAFVFADRAGLLRGLSAMAAGLKPNGPALDDPAKRWLGGETVAWPVIAGARRLHLPGYVFARDRHWIEVTETEAPAQALAPSPRLTGAEDFLTSQIDGSDRLVLGLFLPELARAAAERELGRPVRGLAHLLWGKPVRINGKARQLNVLTDDDGAGLLYQVIVDGDDQAPCHVGEINDAAPSVHLPALWQDGADCSDDFRRFADDVAVHAGPPSPHAPQILRVWRNDKGIGAQLRRSRRCGALPFDPLILDAAWRLFSFGTATCPPAFPQRLEGLWAVADIPADFFVHAGPTTITITDGQGQPCLIMQGITAQAPASLGELRFAEETPS